MSMMAKSRMQQELVAKARLRQAILPGPSEAAADSGEVQAVTIPIADAVHTKVKYLETRLENDKFIPLPVAAPNISPAAGGAVKEPAAKDEKAVKQEPLLPPPRRKLYDSLFDEKTLSEKERIRREFLFGVAASPPPPPPPPTQPAKPPPTSPKAATPPPKEKDESQKEKSKKDGSLKEDEKKVKNKCCTIL
jgi:hypothetical protein